MVRKGFMKKVIFELRVKGQFAFGFMEKSMQNIPERKNDKSISILLSLMRKDGASILFWLK